MTAPVSKPAIGYVRVSTTGQAIDGVSLDAQREKIAAYCDLHGLALARTFADEGLSAKRADNRPGLQDALDAACKAKGVLVVHSLSRLARSTRDAITLADRIEKAGADLASITEKIDTTSAMGRFFFRLMASLGELEREQIGERTSAAMQHMKRQRQAYARPTFGYDRRGDTLAPNPGELAAVALMRRWRASGITLQEIADRLTASGVATKRGGQWHPDTVAGILADDTRAA